MNSKANTKELNILVFSPRICELVHLLLQKLIKHCFAQVCQLIVQLWDTPENKQKKATPVHFSHIQLLIISHETQSTEHN